MYFTKIKYKPNEKNKVELHYQVFNEKTETYDVKTLKSDEDPHPDFTKAMNSLSEDVMEIAEIPEKEGEKSEDSVSVGSVTFTWKEGDFGAVLSASRELEYSNTPLNINTPLKWSEGKSDEEADEILLPSETINKLERLMTEAERFLEGERSQMKLNFQEEQAESE